jgi:hypothetical protein
MPTRAQEIMTPQERQLREQVARQEVQHQELVNLENETVRALQQNSSTFFQRVYSDDFMGTIATGQVLDKAGLIAYVLRADSQYSSFIVSDIRVRLYQGTAVVSGLWSARGTHAGHSFSRQSRIMHVYIYGLSGWKAIASQETLLPG